MESSEQIELNKENRDRLIDSRPTAKGAVEVRGGGLSKNEKELRDMDNSVVIMWGSMYKGTK